MEGVDDPAKPELRGIMLNVFDFIFDQIQDDNEHQREYLVYISYLEIYNEEIRDLLSKDSEKLALKEAADKGVYVKGLKKVWPVFYGKQHAMFPHNLPCDTMYGLSLLPCTLVMLLCLSTH